MYQTNDHLPKGKVAGTMNTICSALIKLLQEHIYPLGFRYFSALAAMTKYTVKCLSTEVTVAACICLLTVWLLFCQRCTLGKNWTWSRNRHVVVIENVTSRIDVHLRPWQSVPYAAGSAGGWANSQSEWRTETTSSARLFKCKVWGTRCGRWSADRYSGKVLTSGTFRITHTLCSTKYSYRFYSDPSWFRRTCPSTACALPKAPRRRPFLRLDWQNYYSAARHVGRHKVTSTRHFTLHQRGGRLWTHYICGE